MSSIISLEGLTTVGNNEDRALADIRVVYNNNIYLWKVYVPQNIVDLTLYLEESKTKIESEIDAKELQWQLLNPKTKSIEDPLTGETITVDILKDEIVKPDVPDYYALRRNEYPPITDQLGAVWKGASSVEYADMQNKISEVKRKYPKPNY